MHKEPFISVSSHLLGRWGLLSYVDPKEGSMRTSHKTQEVLSRAEVSISQTKETVSEALMASVVLRWGCAGSEATVKSVGDYTREKQDED